MTTAKVREGKDEVVGSCTGWAEQQMTANSPLIWRNGWPCAPYHIGQDHLITVQDGREIMRIASRLVSLLHLPMRTGELGQ